jgi:hypothetical protein
MPTPTRARPVGTLMHAGAHGGRQEGGGACDQEGGAACGGTQPSQKQQQAPVPQVRAKKKSKHAFVKSWVIQALEKVLPPESFSVSTEVSSLQDAGGSTYRCDLCVYLKYSQPDGSIKKKYVVIEVDELEHKGGGVQTDLFKTLYLIYSLFGTDAPCWVLRLNVDELTLPDGERACPRLEERLRRVVAIIMAIYAEGSMSASRVRFLYCYYSLKRLIAALMNRCEGRLMTVEPGVEYCLLVRPQRPPGYQRPRQRLMK